jgi:acetyltransferase-like isoleucine patch superfamily enzyme
MTAFGKARRITIRKGTVVLRDVLLGENVRYFSFVNLYGCDIGDDTKIGAFVEIQRGARIGKRCKISSHTFVCEGVHIADDVFIGHGVMFINDRTPRASVGGKPISDEWTLEETFVEDGASIGSNATILCGLRIGRGAVIGAGAVVTRNVAPRSVVTGNPARPLERPKRRKLTGERPKRR